MSKKTDKKNLKLLQNRGKKGAKWASIYKNGRYNHTEALVGLDIIGSHITNRKKFRKLSVGSLSLRDKRKETLE